MAATREGKKMMMNDDVPLPEKLPPFDLNAALSRIKGRSKLLRKMLLIFRKDYAEAGVQLRTHIREGHMEEAERLAHSLKSNAASLGANELAAAALAVEGALRAGQHKEVQDLIRHLEEELRPALAAAGTVE